VVRIHGHKKALAITTDCTPRYCYADPYEGGKQAVAETYRNLSAVGAKPLAITNCLNFANPQRPEIMAQIVECLRGMGDACRALDYPIVSGNVSLYNESKATGGGSAILPTPAIGGVGLLDDHEKMATIRFKDEEDLIFSLGHYGTRLGQSLYLREIHGREDGEPPKVNLDREARHGALIRDLIHSGITSTVHDVSDGGLLVALAEMYLAADDDFGVWLEDWELDETSHFFAESQGVYVVAVSAERRDQLEEMAALANVPCLYLGHLIDRTDFMVRNGCSSISKAQLREASDSFFRDWMEN